MPISQGDAAVPLAFHERETMQENHEKGEIRVDDGIYCRYGFLPIQETSWGRIFRIEVAGERKSAKSAGRPSRW